MKKYISITAALALALASVMILIPVSGFTQNDPEMKKRDPEIKWDVQKDYDEDGNLVWFDSTYSWSWSDFDFGGAEFDSLFEDFFGDFRFSDSLFTSPFGSMPHSFGFREDFPDFLLSNPFDFPFSFPDLDDFFEQNHEMWDRQKEMLEHFYNMQPFGDDSLPHFKHRWYYHLEN